MSVPGLKLWCLLAVALQLFAAGPCAGAKAQVAITRISTIQHVQLGTFITIQGRVNSVSDPVNERAPYSMYLNDGSDAFRVVIWPKVWEQIAFRHEIKSGTPLTVRIYVEEYNQRLEGHVKDAKDVSVGLARPDMIATRPDSATAPGPGLVRWLEIGLGAGVLCSSVLGGLLVHTRRRARRASKRQLARQMEIEEALKENLGRLDHLLGTSSSVIYSLRPSDASDGYGSYRLAFVSGSIEKLLGWPAEECLRNPDWWFQCVHPEDRQQTVSAQPKLFEENALKREYRLRHRDGTYIWIHDQQHLLRDPIGTPCEVVGTWFDITERKKDDRVKELLASLGQRLSAVTLPKEAAQVVLKLADELFGWDMGYVGLYLEETEQLRTVVHYDLRNGRRKELPGSGQLVTPDSLARSALAGKPQLLLREAGASGQELVLDGNSPAPVSLMLAPIRRGGAGIGLLSIQSCAINAYRDEDLVLLQVLADYCGAALERTRAEFQRKEVELALRESEERYALALKGANDGLWDWDFRNGEVYFSPRWKTMLGYDEGEITNCPTEWFNRIHPNDLEEVKAELARHLRGDTPQFETEYRMQQKDGSWRWALCRGVAVRDDDGVPCRMAGSLTDVTARKQAEEKLAHGAHHDSLTDLPNRALFLIHLQRAMARLRRHPEMTFSVLFIDLDRFKVINDSLGHLVGDQLLVHAARRLEACVRPEDTVARLGGDEFTILLEEMDPTHLTRVVERIQAEVSKPLMLKGHEVYTTASIGVTFSSLSYTRPEEMLRDADIAMYRAKQKGKARYELFDPTMHQRALEMLGMESELRRALEREELRVFYQPIFCLATGTIRGFEALIRWQHPERGLVPPGEFLPLAEENGLIVPIGWWVLKEASRQAAQWQELAPAGQRLTISINFPHKQFLQEDLVNRITSVLEETGLAAECLVLEITESELMENAEALADLLKELKSTGLKIHVDDFGTGYSSLAYLHSFPIDALKIDRSFVMRLNEEQSNTAIIRAVTTLAHSLELEVVAEGIETLEQAQCLKDSGCPLGQGYLFSRPVDAGAATHLLSNRPEIAAQLAGESLI